MRRSCPPASTSSWVALRMKRPSIGPDRRTHESKHRNERRRSEMKLIPMALWAAAIVVGGALFVPGLTQAQSGRRSGRQTPTSPVEIAVGRMMAFDKNNDGKLTRDEITDSRLLTLFDRADSNRDGIVTRA